MYDISQLAVADTSFLHLTDAEGTLLFTGEGDDKKPVGINLYSPGSDEYQRAQTKQQNKMVDRLKRKGKSDISAEERREQQASYLADCTYSFENLSYAPAGDATGPKLFKAVYNDARIGFIAEQVQAHLGDWENFTPGSATS